MREGEILALQVRDIGEDKIYIRHSYGSYDGLPTQKKWRRTRNQNTVRTERYDFKSSFF